MGSYFSEVHNENNTDSDLSFIDEHPISETPIQGLLQYLNFVTNEQNYTNDEFSRIHDQLSR